MLPRSRLSTALRAFSSSASHRVHVSHIGSKPIAVPPAVTFTQSPSALTIKGPLGETSVVLHPFVKLDFAQPSILNVAVEDAEIKVQRQMWGTTRTLIFNAITGMSEGFTVPLYLVGVGYRVALEEDPRGVTNGGNGKRFAMKLGYSHTVFVPIPAQIKVEVPLPTKIILSCTDKQQLGLFAAKVRSYRKPEPYKGKVCIPFSSTMTTFADIDYQGIFVGNEQIRIKSVKKK